MTPAASTPWYAILASRYNDVVLDRLIAGAREYFRDQGLPDDAIRLYRCPGALELPALARAVSRTPRHGTPPRAIVVLGCVIDGDTDHYEHVCRESMRGIADLAAEARVAIGNGILTVRTLEQAMQRAGSRNRNKGWEAAAAAHEMAALLDDLRTAPNPEPPI